MQVMVTLLPSADASIRVVPRWPFTNVTISLGTLQRLELCNDVLRRDGIEIVLTRCCEDSRCFSRYFLRRMLRAVGKTIFLLFYYQQRASMRFLFGENGHTQADAALDVALIVRGETIKLLPLGVFTPLRVIRRRVALHHYALFKAYTVFKEHGFVIHSDEREAAQIHLFTSESARLSVEGVRGELVGDCAWK